MVLALGFDIKQGSAPAAWYGRVLALLGHFFSAVGLGYFQVPSLAIRIQCTFSQAILIDLSLDMFCHPFGPLLYSECKWNLP